MLGAAVLAGDLQLQKGAAVFPQLACQGRRRQRDDAVLVVVGEKAHAPEVDGQNGTQPPLQQVYGVQHGTVAPQHEGQLQLFRQLLGDLGPAPAVAQV